MGQNNGPKYMKIYENMKNIWEHENIFKSYEKTYEIYENIWNIYGNIWEYMKIHETCIWTHAWNYINIWKYMKIYENIWKCINYIEIV